MAPVKDAPLDTLSITVSTESRTSKNSARSISTAALLHNASVKSPRSAHAPSYEQMRTAASGESEMEKCDRILSNYRQEDVVYALMTHLKEREGELKRITEQRNLSLKLKLAAETANQQLQGALSIQRNLLHAKEITIKSLEDKLEKCLALTGGEDRIKELSAEVNSLNEEREKVKDAYHKVLTDKDDTIADLKAQLDETNEKLAKAEKKRSKSTTSTEAQLQDLETQLEEATLESSNLKTLTEELSKVIKRKDWMISSIKQENEDQRHREDNLHTHIAMMQESIDTYESKFMGKGIDVPIVLAKLADAECRSKELAETMCQMEIQMSVMRMEFRKHGLDLEKIEMDFPVKNIGGEEADGDVRFCCAEDEKRQPPSIADDDMATLDSILEPYDPFNTEQDDHKDDLSLLKQDVKDGIETIMDGGFCKCACAQGLDMRDDEEADDEPLGIDAVYTDASDTFDED